MKPSPNPPCVNRVADMITDMVFEGLTALPEEDQEQRLTAFCEAASNQLHTSATNSESA